MIEVIQVNYDKIGIFIAQKRKEKGLTQKELAMRLNITDKAVSKWERGLGCPDVSILELLSKELNVSILEILKGRMIEDEVIKVVDVNDYVKDTVNYTTTSNIRTFKKTFSKIILLLIFILGIYLIVLNINHMIYLHSKFEYDFNNVFTDDLKSTIEKTNDNVVIIKNNQGIFSNEDYNEIVTILNSNFDFYKKCPISNLSAKKNFNLNDTYLLDLCSISYIVDNSKLIEILKKYNPIMNDYRKVYQIGISNIYLSNLSKDIYLYRFEKNNFIDLFNINIEKLSFEQEISNIRYVINSSYYLTQLILEIGDINV